jgi:hypothetical protein
MTKRKTYLNTIGYPQMLRQFLEFGVRFEPVDRSKWLLRIWNGPEEPWELAVA